jgi:hypothetical protein
LHQRDQPDHCRQRIAWQADQQPAVQQPCERLGVPGLDGDTVDEYLCSQPLEQRG